MEILGIGPLEFAFIILIALIVLGPKDMVKAGRTLGRILRQIVTSPTWQAIQQTSRELRYLPNKLMREAGLEDLKDQLPEAKTIRKEIGLDNIKKDMESWQKGISDWTTPPPTIKTPDGPLTPQPTEQPNNTPQVSTPPPAHEVQPETTSEPQPEQPSEPSPEVKSETGQD